MKTHHAVNTDLPTEKDADLFLPLIAEQNAGLTLNIREIRKELSMLLSKSGTQKKPEKGNEGAKCLFCSKIFYENKRLQVHIRTKHNIKTDCLYCKAKMKSVGHLQEHVRTAHPVQ